MIAVISNKQMRFVYDTSHIHYGLLSRMETDDEGDITMRTVVEHIKAVEAGSGNNLWVSTSRILQNLKIANIYRRLTTS